MINATTNVTSTAIGTLNTMNRTSDFPDSWYALYASPHPLDMDAFLKSDLLAAHRSSEITYSIIYFVVGPISFISSAAIVYHILKSYKGLSTTYHRLVVGLSIIDMLSSLGNALSTTVTPSEMNYFTPFAIGNVTTCSIQAFLIMLGYRCAPLYTCSICFYYLAIIKYNMRDTYIKAKLEPWFHGVPLVYGAVVLTTLLTEQAFNNPNAGVCMVEANYPPHCIGYEPGEVPKGFSIPCGRGTLNKFFTLMHKIAFYISLLVTPIVIILTMCMMYKSIRDLDKKLSRYGARSLYLVPKPGDDDDEGDDLQGGTMMAKINNVLKRLFLCLDRKKPASRSNTLTDQKKSILYMAIGYALAWTLTWIPLFVYIYFGRAFSAKTIKILITTLPPLQGFFNLFVYMSPKVRGSKLSKRTKVSWPQAIAKAWRSKGEKPRGRIRNSRLSTTKTISFRKTIKQRVLRASKKLSSGLLSRRNLRPNT